MALPLSGNTSKTILLLLKIPCRQTAKMKLIEPEGTYLLWIDCNAYDITDKELENKLLYDAKLWLDMGSMFGPEGNKFFRFNIACPKSVLEKGLGQLAEAFKNNS